MKKAFTLIELLLVMAIIAIIGGTATPFLSNYIVRNSMRQVEDNLISYLRKAQAYSMNGKGGFTWGVCVADNNLNLFYTACESDSIVDSYSLPATIEINGFNEVIFSKTGDSSLDLDLILESVIATKTFSLNKIGSFVGQETLALGAYWPMNEGSGAIITDIVNGNIGTIYGASWVGGLDQSALSFDGDDYISGPHSDSYNFDQEITLEAWIKWSIDPSSSTQNWANIINRNRDHDFGLQHSSDNSKIEFSIETETGRRYLSSASSLVKDEWFYVVGTYDGSEMKLYINGQIENTHSKTGFITNGEGEINLGRMTDGNRYFEGLIDEVRVLDQALTATNVLDRYNALKNENQDLGLVSYWPFDDNIGSLAVDNEDGNDAILYNTTWVPGVISTALEFNGSNAYGDVNDANNLDVTTGLTMMTWVKTNEYKTAKILEKGDWDGHNLAQDIWAGWKASLRGSDGSSYGLDWGGGRADLDTWYHLALTYDGDIGYLYINGLEVDQVQVGLDLATNSRPVNFASDQGSQKFFNGVMDEIYYYDQALSAIYINNYFNNTKPSDEGELLNHWPMSEGVDLTLEDIVGGSNATLINGPIWTTGVLDSAISFDGIDDYAITAAYEVLNVSGDQLTVEAWVEWLGEPSAGESWANIVVKDSGVSWGPHYQIQHSQTNDAFEWVISTEMQSNAYIQSVTEPLINQWYYVVGTYDGENSKIYVNGQLENISNVTGDLDNSLLPALIGAYPGSGISRFFNGTIDEVKIHDRALTAEEIGVIYVANDPGAAPTLPEPISFWNFDEGNGAILNDIVGSNNGSITNPNWVGGKLGQALSFDGLSTRVTLVNSSDLNFTTAMSINCWFQRGGLTTDGYIFFKNSQYILRSDSVGRYTFILYLPSWTSSSMAWADRLQDLNWHMLSAIFDGSTMKIYLDAQELISDTVSGQIQLKSNDVFIGSSDSGAYFTGLIDEMKVYDQALTAEQVTAIYASY